MIVADHLILAADSRLAAWTTPQQGHNILLEKNRRIRSEVTAEVAACGHPDRPSDLIELGVLARPLWIRAGCRDAEAD
jgi:hypothetical protein